MVTDNTNTLAPLLPDRHPQHDLFICDVADAVLKDVMQHMEHPFYSLSKKPETSVKRYRNGENWLEITPSVKGLATIYDKDILIYAISKLMAAKSRGEKIGRRVRINPRDFLIFANRGTGGTEYRNFVRSIERIRGVTISTNIKTGDYEQTDVFGLIDSGSVRRKNGLDGRLEWVDIKLSLWIYKAIEANEVLTMSRDYFRLGKPYERRAYELARKHCGRKPEWRIRLSNLQNKMGVKSPERKFRFEIKKLIEANNLPEYGLELDGENIVFFNRKSREEEERQKEESKGSSRTFDRFISSSFDSKTYEKARKIAVPVGGDIYAWEEEWRDWMNNSSRPEPKSYEAAFLGFCNRKAAEKMPRR